MDDATQKLVARAETWLDEQERARLDYPSFTEDRSADALVSDLLAALEAAQRPPVSGEYTHVVNLARASEAADKGLDALIDYLADLPTVGEWRPPVSPEQRETLEWAGVKALVESAEVPTGVRGLLLGEVFTIREAVDAEPVVRVVLDAILALTTDGTPSDTERNES